MRSRLEEREQFLVDLMLERRAQAVRRARIDFQCGAIFDDDGLSAAPVIVVEI